GAILRGWREKASPCMGVAEELGPRRTPVRHHPALPYRAVPGFVQKLRICNSNTVTKLAFEFLILTAARSGEVRWARRSEIHGDTWVIPAKRMKARQEHRVPLSARCLEILQQVGDDRLFPISNMALTMLLRRLGVDAVPHGFRSSFKDWCAEQG